MKCINIKRLLCIQKLLCHLQDLIFECGTYMASNSLNMVVQQPPPPVGQAGAAAAAGGQQQPGGGAANNNNNNGSSAAASANSNNNVQLSTVVQQIRTQPHLNQLLTR